MTSSYVKYTIVAVIAILSASCVQEDPNSLDPSEVFIKYFGSTGNEQMVDMVQTADSEFLLLGQTNNTEGGDVDFYIVKTDSAGNGIWQMTYGHNHGNENRAPSEDVPSSIRLINNDQNLIAIGTSNVSDTLSIFMINVDVASGEVIDTLLYQYQDDRLGGTDYVNTQGADVLYMEDEDQYILLGSVETWSDSTYPTDPNSIFTLSFNGGANLQDASETPLWVDLTGLRLEDVGVRLIESEGQYFSVSTSTIPLGSNLGYGLRDVFVQEFNTVSGVVINSEFYGSSDQDVVKNVIATNSSLVMTGTSGTTQNQEVFFLRINKTLPKSAANEFTIDVVEDMGITADGSQGMDLVRLTNGDIYIAGQLNGYSNSAGEFKENEIVVFRMDGFGNLDTDNFRIYGSEDNDQANAILLRPDGALIIGATVDFGSTSMMSLFKTNVRGEFK